MGSGGRVYFLPSRHPHLAVFVSSNPLFSCGPNREATLDVANGCGGLPQGGLRPVRGHQIASSGFFGGGWYTGGGAVTDRVPLRQLQRP